MAPDQIARRRIVCAALRADDGSLLLGIRHYSPDMHEQIRQRTDGAKFCHRPDTHQGFVDQHGAYLSREEAWPVALAAGQLNMARVTSAGRLYSEHLY